MSRGNYRKIWIKHNGPIPVDEEGRSYEIHHIDGNHTNNDINNLQCVTLQEHYDIHFSQGDSSACLLISRSLSINPEEKSRLATSMNKERIEEGTHNFLSNIYRKNSIPWSKGLTKNDHPSLKLASEKLSKKFKGRKKSPEWVAKLPQNQKGYKQSIICIENARNGRSKWWKITDPTGIIYEVKNRNQFSKDHNLKDPFLSHVATGKLENWNGWKCERLQ